MFSRSNSSCSFRNSICLKVQKILIVITAYIKRVISHPSFRNFTFKDAELHLQDMDAGECVFRPSSKVDHVSHVYALLSTFPVYFYLS